MASPPCSFSALLDSTGPCLWFLIQSSDYLGQISRHRQLHGLSGDNHWMITPFVVNANSVLSARAGKAPVCLDIIS